MGSLVRVEISGVWFSSPVRSLLDTSNLVCISTGWIRSSPLVTWCIKTTRVWEWGYSIPTAFWQRYHVKGVWCVRVGIDYKWVLLVLHNEGEHERDEGWILLLLSPQRVFSHSFFSHSSESSKSYLYCCPACFEVLERVTLSETLSGSRYNTYVHIHRPVWSLTFQLAPLQSASLLSFVRSKGQL